MPGRFGRVGFPAFCVLELVDSTLTLEMHPRWLWRRFADAGGRLVVRAGEALIFPVNRFSWNGFRVHRYQWIGVQPEDFPVCYFAPPSFAIEGVAILDALEDAGFKVSWDERPFEGA
jgi:hypothetical protein